MVKKIKQHILAGASTVFDILPDSGRRYSVLAHKHKSVNDALTSDWMRVGADIKKATVDYEHKSRR